MLILCHIAGTLRCFEDHKVLCENIRREAGDDAMTMSVIFRQINLLNQEHILHQQIKEHTAAMERLVQQMAKVHSLVVDNHMVLLRICGRDGEAAAPASSSNH